MEHGMRGKSYQVVAVVKGFDLYVIGQNRGIEVLYFFLERFDNHAWVFALAHHHDAFDYVGVAVAANLPQTRQCGFGYFGDVAHENRCPVDVVYDDVLNLADIVQQANTANNVCLAALFNHIAAYVDVAFGYGVEQLQRGNVVL